jgi:hypothetical protein
VISGNETLADLTTVSYPGTGSTETVSVDLGTAYDISKGLNIGWSMVSTSTSTATANVYGYGAKIKYNRITHLFLRSRFPPDEK